MIGCIVLGEKNAFPIDFDTGKTIGHLKVAIKEKKSVSLGNTDADALILWKVDIPESKKHEIYEGIDIKEKFGGEELDGDLRTIGVYFKSLPTSGHIHIIVEKPPPATTVSSIYIIPEEVKVEIKNKVIKTFPHINPYSIGRLVDALALIWHIEALECDPPITQDDPCFKLKMEPSFFKISLPSAITKQSTTPVDLCLPPHESKSGMKYLNPFYDDPQFIDTVSLVLEKLMNNPRDITVLAGVSGGGKTSTAFGISTQRWTIYVDFTPSAGQYGDFMGQELEDIRSRPPEYGQFKEQRVVFDMLDSAIISHGLLLIKMLVQGKISTPREWLFSQLRMKVSKIKETLRSNKTSTPSTLIDDINACLKMNSLILIFDEAQVLCNPVYGQYNGSSLYGKKWNLLQAYIDHLTHLPVTCLIAGTQMHMASGISLDTSIGKVQGSHAHIVLKLPFLSQNDVQRNLEAVIDLTDVTSKTYNYLIYVLRGRPRNCASFVRKLISERKSSNRTKDEEIRKLIRSWLVCMSSDMANYLDDTCKYVGANNLHPEKAIMDVLRLRVFYNQKFSHAIELLRHNIIPCISPECITMSHKKTSDKNEININPSLESYFVAGIEEFLLRREKTLVDIFVDNIILLNNTSSIGNELDAVFITAIIQKHKNNVQKELNKWKNDQKFDLPSWITPTMIFKTTSNLSGTVPLAKYVNDKIYYRHAIQPEIYAGSDLVLSLADEDQNVILLSACCTVSGSPIKRKKIKDQLIKSCMKFQYMECPRKRKNLPCIQIGLDDIPANHEEEEDDMEEDDMEEDDLEEDDMEEDDLEEDDLEEDDLEKEKYKQDLDFGGEDYDLDYTENTKKYRISRIPRRARNHKKIETSTKNRRHIYVSLELPHRQGKRPRLFRINEYGDLVIIVDDRNMEHVFGPVIKKLVKRISEK
ncbi:hypothetical protein RclHR1_30730001 [Rhizophagus clarus]|nr:hypothetical protein RclHR1_30730001 [Rhizophagus clarus]